jgi:hypothetical protein
MVVAPMSFELNEKGRLLPGRHRTTLQEIEQFFVDGAPHRERRRLIYRGFVTWLEILRTLCPNVTLWIDGGFTTHKDVPPKDVDVTAIISVSDLNSMDEDQQNTFDSLMTKVGGPNEHRVQPMGGLVDGFYAVRGQPDGIIFWHNTWSAVYVDGAEVVGELKGYLEVKFSDA